MNTQPYPPVNWTHQTCDYCGKVNGPTLPLVIQYIGCGADREEEYICESCLARQIRATERP